MIKLAAKSSARYFNYFLFLHAVCSILMAIVQIEDFIRESLSSCLCSAVNLTRRRQHARWRFWIQIRDSVGYLSQNLAGSYPHPNFFLQFPSTLHRDCNSVIRTFVQFVMQIKRLLPIVFLVCILIYRLLVHAAEGALCSTVLHPFCLLSALSPSGLSDQRRNKFFPLKENRR